MINMIKRVAGYLLILQFYNLEGLTDGLLLCTEMGYNVNLMYVVWFTLVSHLGTKHNRCSHLQEHCGMAIVVCGVVGHFVLVTIYIGNPG